MLPQLSFLYICRIQFWWLSCTSTFSWKIRDEIELLACRFETFKLIIRITSWEDTEMVHPSRYNVKCQDPEAGIKGLRVMKKGS